MLTDFAKIWLRVCNLTSQCWCRISLKSVVVCQSYGNVYSVIVFFVDTVYIPHPQHLVLRLNRLGLTFFIQRFNRFFYFVHVFTFLNVFYFFSTTFSSMIYIARHRQTLTLLLACLPRENDKMQKLQLMTKLALS